MEGKKIKNQHFKTTNIKPEIEEIIKPFLERLKNRNEVIGVVLLGGLGKRNFLDEYSDLDIAVFITKEDKAKFPLPFEFHYKYQDRLLEFNIHQLVIEDELEGQKWSTGKIEAYINGKIIYDTNEKIKKLIAEKAVFDEEMAFNRLVWIIQQYKWRGQIHALRAYKRGYPEAAHDILNNCAEILLEAVYLLNKQYVPHKKWALVFFAKLPNNFSLLNKFKLALLVKDFSQKEIERRIKILNDIYEIVSKGVYLTYPSFPNDPWKYYYQNFVQINKVTIMDVLFNKLTGNCSVISDRDKEKFGELCFHIQDLI